MTLDGRKLKETGVRLLLSSRSEMQKVIEMARQQTVSVFQLNTPPVQAPPPVIPNPQILLAQQMIRHQLPFNPNMAPLGVAPPRLNFPMQQLLQPPPQMLIDRNANDTEKKVVGRDRRRSRSRERHSRGRSRSRDRSNSRDRTRRNNRSRSRSRDRTSSHRRRRRSYSRDYDSDESDSRSSKRKSVTPPKAKEPVQIWENQAPFNFRAVYNNNSNGNSNDSAMSRGNGRAPAPPTLDKNAFGEFQRLRDRRNEPQRPTENSNDNAIDLTEDDHNCCVKVTNIEKTTGYKDLRRFFQGLAVRQNGLKMINNEQGKRSGVAFVRFHRPESRKFALMRCGQVLNGNKLVVTTLDDNEFEEAVDSYRPPPNGSASQLQQLRTAINSPPSSAAGQPLAFDQIIFTCLKVTDLPTLTTEQDIMKYFSEYGLMHIILTKDKQKRNCAFLKLNRAEDAKRALQEKNFFSMGHNKKITVTMCSEAVFEEVMNSTIIEDMPPEGDEKTQQVEESAVVMNEEKSSTRQKAASSRWGEKVDDPILSPTSSINTDNGGLKSNSSRWSTDEQQTITPALNPILSQLNLSLPFLNSLLPQAAAALGRTDINLKQQHQPQQQVPPQQQAPVQAVSRDPRLKNVPNNSSAPNQRLSDPRSAHFNPNSRPGDSDCVVVSNLEPSCSDLDVASFFSKAGIVPMRVHILLNTSGGPSGDAFVEFSNAKDADMALLQNERLLGKNPVFVETIPREQVNEVLSSFGGGGSGNPRLNGNGGSAVPPSSIYNQFAATGFDPMMRGRGQGMPQQRPPFMPPEQARKGDTNVLMLNNVPYRAGVEDIIDFFAGYDIRPQDVMRRFNDNGQATAEAKVRFKNPAEAKKAYEEKKFGKMSNRTIFLDFDH